MSTLMEDDIKRWTAKRKTALVLDIIQFTITNNSASSVSGSLLYLAEGTSSMVLSVPEPATWASFALGLIGIAFAATRQRRLNTGA